MARREPLAMRMTYIKVNWLHTLPNEPVWLYSELNAERCETRKVEIYADGRRGYASEHEQSDGTWLGQIAVPTLEEIGADPQFDPVEIPREEFERVWTARQSDNQNNEP